MRRLLLALTAFFAAAVAAVALAAPARAAWVWPVHGDVITQYRNGSDPYAAGQHRGIDIAAPVGTPVVAAAGGEVLFAGTAGSSGLTVSVRTGDGYDSSYLHLSAVAVRAGAHVSAGERLGAVGTSGTRSAVQPHLHFGVREAGTRHAYLDPLSLLPPATAPPPSEAPRPAPSPAPAPLAARPAPAPTGAPRPAPEPAPRGAPHPIPAPRPVPAPGRVPRGAPRPAPAPRPIPAPRPAPGPAPRGAPRPVPAPAPLGAPAGERASSQAPARTASGPQSSPSLSTQRAERGRAASTPSGPDLGWALACAGLLLAAGLLGLTHEGRTTTARSGARVAGAMRPLLGRR